jgi:endonuclease/exonuclease/phosphatase family metal-dependent hydrolase
MRLATFNVENMFERPSIMNLHTWKEGKPILEDFTRLSNLIQRKAYSEMDKKRMMTILAKHKGLLSRVRKTTHIRLHEIRGRLLKKPRDAPVKIVANGRDDWIGWFELRPQPIKETAIENTARVIREVNADVLCLVEVEDRTALTRFNKAVIPKVHGPEYKHAMLIDGNDDRGIDVGILTKGSYDIQSILSHVDDIDTKGTIFSRDCAEYQVGTPSGKILLLLINHFKSKGNGSQIGSDTKRKRQATRVRQIYEERKGQGYEYVAIVGDLNDTPDRDPLQPLLGNSSDLIDVMNHDKYAGDGRQGTYGHGHNRDKLDYILMSPELSSKMKRGGIERRGVWGGEDGGLFPHFDEINVEKDAASDHAALWADVDI